ncbi:chemotaxis protein [Halobacteriales archaeon QS_1_68_17]|nr:MAG: chemotaxis protein [Halobacteriales archaeon QS_1_68_17]
MSLDAQPTIEASLLTRTIDLPLLVVDDEGTVVVYDDQIAELIDVPREEALGSDELGYLAYGERGQLTMAEKIVRAPQRAHREYEGLDTVDGDYSLLRGFDGPVYEDTSTVGDTDIWFIATPLYRGDEFAGVIEIVQERSQSSRRQAELADLVEELTGTLRAFQRGEFDARVSFDRRGSVLDDDVLGMIDVVDELGGAMERMTGGIEQDIDELSASIERVRKLADEIASEADTQHAAFADAREELEAFSATMEEVASNAQEVAAQIEDARNASGTGLESIEDASGRSEQVLKTSADLVETVGELGDRMTEIRDVVDIIAEVADQTNLLALNANIEAARAGEDGDGFAVVAEEVKALANETQEHTDRIAGQIGQLQAQVDETVEMVEQTHEHVAESDEQVGSAAEAFEEIADLIDAAAVAVDEIADRTDDQAESVEAVMATVDEAAERADAVRERGVEIGETLH